MERDTGEVSDQWVGLIDLKCINNDSISIESAVIKYMDKAQGELTRLALEGERVNVAELQMYILKSY